MILPEVLNPKVIKLTRAEFEALSEYSITLPTGTTIGRRWKRNLNAYRQLFYTHLHPWDGSPVVEPRGDNWWLGEYAPSPKPKTVLILWSKIELSPT